MSNESKIKVLGQAGKGDCTDSPAFDYLRPFEPAARLMCKTMGLDPDRLEDCPDPTGVFPVAQRKQWIDAANDLRHLSISLTCLKETAGERSIVLRELAEKEAEEKKTLN